MKKLIILLATAWLLPRGSVACAQGHSFYDFEPDERLFTAYALMNAGGYDHDYKPMHPLRREVRAHLDTVLSQGFKARLRDFYHSHGGGNFLYYGEYALHCGSAPGFRLAPGMDTIYVEYTGLDSLLCEFYDRAGIAALWEKYRDTLRAINDRYAPYGDLALRQITDFCRVSHGYFRDSITGTLHYQIMPLMSHFTGYVTDAGNDCWIVYGPKTDEEEGPGAFYHEALHKVVNPVVYAHPELNRKLAVLLPLAQEALRGSYNDLDELICESLVRTIDRFLTNAWYDGSSAEKLRGRIDDEYRLGHILCFYLMENLPRYVESGRPLSDYYPELVAGIDPVREAQRWREYRKAALPE